MKNVEKLVEQTVQAVKSCWKWTGNVYVWEVCEFTFVVGEP